MYIYTQAATPFLGLNGPLEHWAQAAEKHQSSWLAMCIL